MEKEIIEGYYQNLGKGIVDTLFDSKTFNEKLTRDDLKAVEDYLASILQGTARSSKKMTELAARFKNY